MNGMRSLSGVSDSQLPFPGKPSRSSVLEIDCWTPSRIQAISPLVGRLMRWIEGAKCVPGKESDIELALRQALENAVVHGNQEDPERKVHVRCRCQPGKQISIVVTDQGKGFDFEKIVGDSTTTDPSSEQGRGIQLIKACMDDVHFERGGSQVHMRKRSRSAWSSRSATMDGLKSRRQTGW